MNYPACAKTPFKPAYRITLPGRDDGQIFLIQPSCPAPFFTHPNRRVSNLRKNSRKKKLAIILHLVYYNKCAHEVSTDNLRHGPLAQLAEHLTLNQGVQGSNPWSRSLRSLFLQTLELWGRWFFCVKILQPFRILLLDQLPALPETHALPNFSFSWKTFAKS